MPRTFFPPVPSDAEITAVTAVATSLPLGTDCFGRGLLLTTKCAFPFSPLSRAAARYTVSLTPTSDSPPACVPDERRHHIFSRLIIIISILLTIGGMDVPLTSVPSTSRLKGALRWSQAEDAAARINIVKSQVDAAGRGSALRGDLAKGLLELDSIRQFLHEGIQLSNQESLRGGGRDQLLHSALEKGLADLESVKSDLVSALHAKQSVELPSRRERAPSARDRAAPSGAGRSFPAGAAPTPPPRAPSGTNFSQQRRNMHTDRSEPLRSSSVRPSSAPVRKGDGGGTSASSTTLRQPPAKPQRAVPSPPSAGSGEWGKYQDWAQNVLNRVHSRKQQKATAETDHSTKARPNDQYEEEIQIDDGDDDDDEGGEENGQVGRDSQDQFARTARDGARPPFSSGINRARPLSATARAHSLNSSLSSSGLAGRGARPESANFSQQRGAVPQSRPSGTSTFAARNRPTTAGMSVRTEAPQPSAVRLHPQAQALREQGNIFFQQKKYQESADAYGKAIKQFEPNSETLYCNRAAAYLMLNKCEEALGDAQMAISIDPTHVKAHWRAAKACLYLGRSDAARQLYTAAHKLADVQTEADAIAAEMKAVDIAEKCRRCLRLREYSDALVSADQLLEIFPINGPCSGPWVCLKGEALLYTDAHEAGSLLASLCIEDPSNAEAWLIRGKALFYASHDAISTQSALSYLNKARDLDAGKASVVVVSAPGAAQSFLNTVAGRSASLINVIETFSKLRDMGNSAYAGGKWSEAYDAYTRCLTVDPCNSSLKAIILCNRAAVSIQCEKWKDAMDDVNASISNNNTNAKAFTRRARIHQHNGDYDSAVRDLQTAVQMYPSSENQERLQQAQEQQRAHQRAQQQRNTNASYTNAQGRAGSYRFFGTTHEGFKMPRPNTAGSHRTQSASGMGSSYSSFFSRAGASGAFFGSGTTGGGTRSNTNQGASQAGGASQGATGSTRYYQILAITKAADEKAVTKAYREAALKWHPDKWASGTDQQRAAAEATFKEINVAYSVLKDPSKRRQYDAGVLVS